MRVKPINFQTETLPAVRKKAVFGPQSADNFSELSLMEKTLPLPYWTAAARRPAGDAAVR